MSSTSEPIIVVDSSEIREGNLKAVHGIIEELVEFVETNEDRPIAYRVYVNDRGTTMTVVQIHPDSASMEHHMKVAAPAFAKFEGLIRLSTMDVYGHPSEELLDQLRAKISKLGDATIAVHELQAGFARIESR